MNDFSCLCEPLKVVLDIVLEKGSNTLPERASREVHSFAEDNCVIKPAERAALKGSQTGVLVKFFIVQDLGENFDLSGTNGSGEIDSKDIQKKLPAAIVGTDGHFENKIGMRDLEKLGGRRNVPAPLLLSFIMSYLFPHQVFAKFDMLKNMDPPLGFGSKCPDRLAYKKLIRMNMPIDNEGKVNFTTTLFALIRENLSIKMRSAEEMDQADVELRETINKLWPLLGRTKIELLVPGSSSVGKGKLTVGKIYGGLLILDNWKQTKFGTVDKPLTGKVRIVKYFGFPSLPSFELPSCTIFQF